jgi:hypothetical protein
MAVKDASKRMIFQKNVGMALASDLLPIGSFISVRQQFSRVREFRLGNRPHAFRWNGDDGRGPATQGDELDLKGRGSGVNMDDRSHIPSLEPALRNGRSQNDPVVFPNHGITHTSIG